MALNQNIETENTRSTWSTAIGVMGFILVFAVGGGLADSDWKMARDLAPVVIWIGMSLQLFYFFLFIGNSKIAKALGGQFASQVAFAALTWFLFTQASVSAGGYINGVFGLGDSAFPLTQNVLTFVSLFVLGKPLFLALTIWGAFAFLYYLLSGGDGSHRSIQIAVFAASGLVLGIASYTLAKYKFNDELMPKKAYLMARALEFNENLNCPGTAPVGNGVFLGPAQDRVLVDTTKPSMSWTAAIYANAGELDGVKIPEKFEIYECRKN